MPRRAPSGEAAHASGFRSRPRASTGDSRDQQLVTDPKTQCFACHQGPPATDFVFSAYRR